MKMRVPVREIVDSNSRVIVVPCNVRLRGCCNVCMCVCMYVRCVYVLIATLGS
jgi:hypothetical protein